MEHDPRCEGTNDEKLLADVKEYGWHVIKIFEKDGTPGWAFSIGLYKNFNHPEVVVFGLNDDLMHSVINSIGQDVCGGKTFVVEQQTSVGIAPDIPVSITTRAQVASFSFTFQ